MSIINMLFGVPLGYMMYACYKLAGDYGISIILFTFFAKLLMFPLSLYSQKNSIIMVKIRPLIDEIRQRNLGNNVLIVEEQKALYKQEGYSSISGILPLLLQVPIILGLINVIYNPLQHLLHFSPELISQYLQQAATYLGVTLESMGSGAQLKVLELAQQKADIFQGFAGLDVLREMDTFFLGTNLAVVPSLRSITILYPILSGLSALALAMYQNKHNILQQAQGTVGRWGMTLFLVAFSAFFAYILPSGIGLYWIVGNLLSIPVLYLCNLIYDPKPYMEQIAASKQAKPTKEERRKERALNAAKRKKQREDKKRFAGQKDKQLVFYSEGSGFYKYLGGFVEYVLNHSDITVHYVTSDFHDRIFENKNERIQKYYIGPVALIQFMMLMDADMVVMTTPELDKYHLKRSLVRKDIEYVYLEHAITSFHMTLKKGALDHYNTIFCYGPNHVTEVRQLEALYKLPAKRLVKTGYPLLDEMLSNAKLLPSIHNDPKVILIAPSWQKDNILEYCLDATVKPLLSLGHRVIVRPHPEFVKRFPDKIRKIRADFAGESEDLFLLQTDFSSNETVYTADLVITDWSSIANEFSYATKKPSLFINTPMKVMNPEYTQIEAVPLEISLRDMIGKSIDVDKLDTLPSVIQELFDKQSWYADRINQVLNEYIYDVGNGARGGGEYIISRLAEIAAAKASAAEQGSQAAPQEASMLNTLDARMIAYLQGRQNEEAIQFVLSQPLPEQSEHQATKGEILLGIMGEIEQAIGESRSH